MLRTRELRHVDYIGHKTPETRKTQGVRKHVRLKERVVQKHLEHEARETRHVMHKGISNLRHVGHESA